MDISFDNLVYLTEKKYSKQKNSYSEDEQFDISDVSDRNNPVKSHQREGQNYNLVERSIEQTIRSIKRAYQTKTSILIYGDPGLGKSSIVRSVCSDLASLAGGNRKVIDWNDLDVNEQREIIDKNEFSKYFIIWDIRTAMMEPSDITGMINIRSTKEYIQMKPQLYAYIMGIPGSAGLLFLDEINQGQKQVQNALFQLVLDRKIDRLRMNDKWGIVAAANLGGEFGNDPLPIALTSRFKAGVLVADSTAWLKWARAAGINEYICSFVEADPEKNFYEKPTPDNQFACPRSFVTLSKDMDIIWNDFKSNPDNHPDVMNDIELSAGESCGPVWAARFINFLRFSRKFDWDQIVKTPKNFVTLKKSNKDIANAVDTDQLQGLLLYLVKQVEKRVNDPKGNIKKTVHDLINILVELDEEWQAVFMRKLNLLNKNIVAKIIAEIYANKSNPIYADFIANHFTKLLGLSDKKTL